MRTAVVGKWCATHISKNPKFQVTITITWATQNYFRSSNNRRTKIARGCLRKFSTELFDRPRAPLRLKARLLKAEVMEALLYGCMTWAPCNAHYRKLRTTHHKLLLRVIGYHRVHGTYRKMSYARALKETGSQSVEATTRQRRLLFAGALAIQGDKRLPKRLMFAEILEGGGDTDPGQPAQHWQKSLRDDFKAFGALHGSTPTTDRRTFRVDRLVWTERGDAQLGGSAVVYRGSVECGDIYGVVAQERRRG